ncbi:MAG TPA: molybdopterin molybdotransferase MoeA [Bacteroidia bacterium]|jgi:molybdopterin molybdotransferase|nr:molybdopterin molybdotransferase MoeA [Bacteroidia bacterium]
MITVEEARKILVQTVAPLTEVKQMDVSVSAGYRLAEDIPSPIDLPPFNQSNVDGYALGPPISGHEQWIVVEEISTGAYTNRILGAGEAARIFTGACVPEGSELVVMQEKVQRTGTTVTCIDESRPGQFIRKQGSQIRKGETGFLRNTLITPAVISLLEGMGIPEIPVFRKPVIALLITGNELERTKGVLPKGKNYESIASALQACMQGMGLGPATIQFVKDDKAALSNAVQEGLKADLLLVTGGISVGDYDYVKEVLDAHKIQCLFHGIAQKPGKPLYLGKNKHTLVFGLPGNPASTLTCFYEYVYPALRILQGREKIFLKTLHLPLLKPVTKNPGLAFFLKARMTDTGVEPLEGQDSYIMKSLAEANAFVYLPAQQGTTPSGSTVEVHVLPEP